MPFDDALADRVRDALAATHAVVEKKMFGGLAFMVRGHMTVGVLGKELMVRVGKDGQTDALSMPGARPMDFTGKPMKGMVYVSESGVESDAQLTSWVTRGLAFTGTLPAK